MSKHVKRNGIEVVVKTKPEFLGNFRLLDKNRGTWMRDFSDDMLADPRLRGTVLDIGSSAGEIGAAFGRLYANAEVVDGVDPDPAIAQHPHLRNRWNSTLEGATEIQSAAYDAAFALLVVEHVSTPRAFLETVYRVLKPGGVFYATTPSSHHPFAWIVRIVERLGLKGMAADSSEQKINRYPAYYRMNSLRVVEPLAREIGFERVEFYMYPCVNWDQYFPRAMRFVPHLYDRLLGGRFGALSQIVMMRLDKPKDSGERGAGR